jgi:hypothetical protein
LAPPQTTDIAATPSWWYSVQHIIDGVPHPILVGCAAIAVGALSFALAGPFKSKLDQARRAKTERARARLPRLRLFYAACLLAGLILTAAGTGLTINGGQIIAQAQVQQAQAFLNESRQENERARKEYELKIQTVLSALNAARQDQTRLLTDEKIKGLQKDLLAWVDDFAARKSDKQRQFEEAKIANTQKEIQMSSDVAPVFLFVLRVLEESFRMYAKKAGSDIQINMRPLPQNYYEASVNTPPRSIQFKGQAIWRIYVNANPPANEDNAIQLSINFMSTDGRNGNLSIYEINKGKKFSVAGGGTLPTPDTAAIFGEYDVEGYEETLGRILQRLVEAQLIQTP